VVQARFLEGWVTLTSTLPGVNRILTLPREFRGTTFEPPRAIVASTALGSGTLSIPRESIMTREDGSGSIWADLVAILSVALTRSALFVPLLAR
jgi:hypothetical protein